MSIYSGVICAQSRQLSDIALNFGRFCPLKFCWRYHFQKLYPQYHACLAPRRTRRKVS